MSDYPVHVQEGLQRLTEQLVGPPKIHHALMAVESTDGSRRWFGSAAAAGHEAPTPHTPFFIASIDKLYNATIALRLYESGLLDLDSPLRTYLPESLVGGLHRMGGVDHTDAITVRHLMGHSSGLADWYEDRPRGGRTMLDDLMRAGDRDLTMEAFAALVREQLKPHFPPADLSSPRHRVRYSDTNFILLVAIIEAVTGEPLAQVHERLLYRPLGLRHTYVAGAEPLEPTPAPTPLGVEGRPLEAPAFMRFIRGMYTTTADAIAFLRHWVRGEIFDDPATGAMVTRRWHRFGLPLDRAALRSPMWPIQYGLGMMRVDVPRVLSPIRPFIPFIGHTGSTGCWLFYCSQLETLVTGTVDEATAGALPYRITPKVLKVLGTAR
jgi:D-alanyl-D-alanine carboxypeptidase